MSRTTGRTSRRAPRRGRRRRRRRRSAGGPRRAGPWRRTRRCVPRPRRSGSGPWGSSSVVRSGRVMHEHVRRGGSASVDRHRRRGRRRSRGRSRARGRSPRPRRRTLPRPNRSKIVLAVLGGRPRDRCRAPRVAPSSPSRGGADGDVVAGVGVLDGVVGQLEQRLGDRAARRARRCRVATPSSCQSRSPSPRALASRVWVSVVEVDRARGRGSRGGGSWRAGSGRPRAATSGRPRRAAARGSRRRSSGRRRRAARGGRAARSAGSCSSWPASSRNWRWPAKPASSRSSIALMVRVSAVMSSLPCSGMRRDRSVVVMSRAVSSRVRSGASSRPDWKRGDGGDQAERQQRDERVGLQRAVELVVLVGEEVDDDQRALALRVARPAPAVTQTSPKARASMTLGAAVVVDWLDGALVGRLVEDLLAVAVAACGSAGLAADVADEHLVVVGDVAGQEDVEQRGRRRRTARRCRGRCRRARGTRRSPGRSARSRRARCARTPGRRRAARRRPSPTAVSSAMTTVMRVRTETRARAPARRRVSRRPRRRRRRRRRPSRRRRPIVVVVIVVRRSSAAA